MRKIKKATAILLTGIILSGTGVNTYAVTPQYRPPQTDFTIEGIVDAVKDYLKENPIDIDFDIDISETNVEKTEITQAIYYHKRLFFNKSRLQVKWKEVPKADYYKIKVEKKNGDLKIYESKNNSLFIYEKSDDFVTGCIRSGKIEVKTVKSNGAESDWSESKTISCNSLH